MCVCVYTYIVKGVVFFMYHFQCLISLPHVISLHHHPSIHVSSPTALPHETDVYVLYGNDVLPAQLIDLDKKFPDEEGTSGHKKEKGKVPIYWVDAKQWSPAKVTDVFLTEQEAREEWMRRQ